MSDVKLGPPKWFWAVAIVFLLWNLFGVSNYLMSVTATSESLMGAGYTAEQAEFMLAMPSWYAAVFALAVWSGLLGAILLLLRKIWAFPVFVFGLLMVILAFILDAVGGSFAVLGTPYLAIMTVVLIASFIEVWFARRCSARGILR